MKKLFTILVLLLAGVGAAHAGPKLKSQSMSDQELDEVAAGDVSSGLITYTPVAGASTEFHFYSNSAANVEYTKPFTNKAS